MDGGVSTSSSALPATVLFGVGALCLADNLNFNSFLIALTKSTLKLSLERRYEERRLESCT